MSSPRSDEPKAPRDVPSIARNSKDALLILYTYRALYNDIGKYNRPEGDIRQRFTRYRAIRAAHAEHRVGETGSAYDNFMSQIESGSLNADDQCVKELFEEIMDSFDRDLERVSRIYEEDSRAALAPTVNQYIMENMFRPYALGKDRAPNGESLAVYGSRGEAVPPNLAALRDCEEDFLRTFILGRLVRPLSSYIYVPYSRFCNKFLHRDLGARPQGVDDGVLGVIVTAVEHTMFVLWLAGSVALLSSLVSMRDRIIATSFISLAFPYITTFLSKEAKGLLTLNTAYWAVMAVFIATSAYESRRD